MIFSDLLNKIVLYLFFILPLFVLYQFMKHLFLLRHAHSAEKQPGFTDKDRELTTNGMRQAAAAGAFLKSREFNVDVILTSTALRAATTAEIVAGQINLAPEFIHAMDDLYLASTGTLLNIIRQSDNHRSLLIVGHNPTISYFAEHLTRTHIPEVGPANILVLRTTIAHWKELQQGDVELAEQFTPD